MITISAYFSVSRPFNFCFCIKMSQAYWFNNNKIQASIQNKHISTKNKCKKERKKQMARKGHNQFKRLETWLFKTEGKILIPLFPFGHGGETSA